jgi:hypothetical protein
MKRNIQLTGLITLVLSLLIAVTACNKSDKEEDVSAPNSDQYIYWNFKGSHVALSVPSDTIVATNFTPLTTLTAYSTTNGIAISFSSMTTGTFVSDYFQIHTNSKDYPGSVTLNVTEYGTVGNYIVGTYSGNITDSTANQAYAVSGGFRMKRR